MIDLMHKSFYASQFENKAYKKNYKLEDFLVPDRKSFYAGRFEPKTYPKIEWDEIRKSITSAIFTPLTLLGCFIVLSTPFSSYPTEQKLENIMLFGYLTLDDMATAMTGDYRYLTSKIFANTSISEILHETRIDNLLYEDAKK